MEAVVVFVVKLFSVRYEAAKLIEEEQEAEIEQVERRKAALTDVVTQDSSESTDQLTGRSGRSASGGWHESESGLFWEPCDSSVLDSSSDGLAAMHAARQQAAALSAAASNGASQLDDELNYTRGTATPLCVLVCVCVWKLYHPQTISNILTEVKNNIATSVNAARVVLWLDHSDAMCSRT